MNEPIIQVGRRVRYRLPYGDYPIGVIANIKGELKGRKPNPGVMQIIRPDDATFTIVTFDGRRFENKREHDVGRNAIGGVELLDRVHTRELIDRLIHGVAKRQAAEAIAKAQADEAFRRAEAARVVTDPPLFYWNGIKDAKGAPLQRAYFSDMGPRGSTTGKYPPHTIAIHARDYKRFSAKVRDHFTVKNDSDMMTDYFENDSIYVIPEHPLYPQAKAALEAREAHYAKRRA